MLLALTQAGRKRAREVIGSRGGDSTFLASLSENGPSSIEDISVDLRITQRQAQSMAGKLSKRGLIRREE